MQERKTFTCGVTYLKRVYMDQNALLLIAIVLDDLGNQIGQNYSVNYMYKLYIALLSWGMRTIKLPYSQKT